ncbi:AEC family transporter [Brenneria tiliae]|uniref:AEC family transporter n=1 Tax=Brenneria tiliae TaxID=2914984 RepID=UPI002014E1B8|nr:AEC family transporter [Brenneria tiliae]MCL2896143.1 AEC family transporter [Brenneria tiliae]MCL2900662.1 AEC family transporter [Brenneria tiliae]
MVDVLIKAFSFVFVIIIGYWLKQRGVLQRSDSLALSKIMMNITLPAAVITGFASFKVDHSLLILVALGLGCNLLLMGAGYWIARKGPDEKKAFYMINSPGYNIGCFTLPYVQSFLGPVGIVATCLFDAGNSVICTGGSYVAASHATGRSAGLKNTFKRLFSSIPFDVYMLLLIAALFDLYLPSQITLITSTIGNANPFLAMLIIGMMLEININRAALANVAKVLLLRYSAATLFAVAFYYYTPLPLEIRQVLAVAVFSPVSSLAPLFTSRFSVMYASVSSFANSLSVIISITIMTTLLTLMQS